ncbi:MAB_1171c family putative transporter [Streptomyces sp. NPDC048664]|uniref:MAB_1171c family putative transporter n=1 Tax=Streptomyces sp. NPDC048664 TaxID=3154505 RepID=UPI0034463B35
MSSVLFVVVHGVLAVISWSAFTVKAKDLARDRHNRELRLLCLAIGTFATPFFFASPPFYTRVDAALGRHNVSMLIVHTTVAVFLTSTLALLASRSSARPTGRSGPRLRYRLVVGYGIASIVAMAVLFFLSSATDDAEHPLDFDTRYGSVPSVCAFLLVSQCLFTVSMVGLIRMCRHCARIVPGPWLRRGLRVVAAGAVAGLCYSLPKAGSVLWNLCGTFPLATVTTVLAPMAVSVAGALFAIGFTMPVWGVRVGAALAWRHRYRAYRRRLPLWEAITRAFPEIVLVPPPASRLALARELDFFLSRQVIEILDGEMRLRARYDDGVGELARDVCAAHRITGARAEAFRDALRIAAALRAHTAGLTAARQGARVHDSTDGDLDQEAARLTRVAEALHSPLLTTTLPRLTPTPAQQGTGRAAP